MVNGIKYDQWDKFDVILFPFWIDEKEDFKRIPLVY